MVYKKLSGELSCTLTSLVFRPVIVYCLWKKFFTSFQIEIIAVRGSGFRSDAAIDSVRLRHGACVGGLNKFPLFDLSDGVPLCKRHFLGANCSYVSKLVYSSITSAIEIYTIY